MKIGIDAKFAHSRFGGIGSYSTNIINNLAEIGKDEIIAFIPSSMMDEVDLQAKHRCLQIEALNAEKNFSDKFDFRVYWEQEILKERLLNGDIDVFFSLAFYGV